MHQKENIYSSLVFYILTNRLNSTTHISKLTISCSEVWQWVITPLICHDALHDTTVVWEWSDPQSFNYDIWQVVWEKLWNKTCTIMLIIIHQIFSLAYNWSKCITWPNIPQPKLVNIWEYPPIFKTAQVAKRIWRIINKVASIWGENMLGYIMILISSVVWVL